LLRPYQAEAIEAVLTARRSGTRRMVVCLPTGAGKTVIFSHLARIAKKQVLVLAHREELLTQAKEKIERALLQGDGEGHVGGEHAGAGAGARAGAVTKVVAIEQGSQRASEDAKVMVCSIRSLREDRLARLLHGRDVGLVIYDECHHAAADDNMRVLRQLGVFDDPWTGTLLGFTATTARGDGRGLDEVFEKIVYTKTLPEMVDAGYLVPLRGFRVATTADLTRITTGGATDFREDELAEAVDIEERNALVARSIQELARDRRTIAFCVTVGHAKNLSRSLNVLGVPAGIVHGAMPSDVRAKVLADFRAGRIQVLTNVAVLTEGFDDPGVSCIAMARPTRSEGLYAQCVGRGTRLFPPDKKDCLILDFVDLSDLSLCTLPSLFGAPRDLDLQGGDASEASRVWNEILFDKPGFEVEAGAVTLQEIQERAASFNPLTLETHEDVRAISGNAWFSLGRYGVALHFERWPGRPTEILVLKRQPQPTAKKKRGVGGGGRGRVWEVSLDGKVMEHFSRLEEAVQAADYEITRMGRSASLSALENAVWRREGDRAALLRKAVWERVYGIPSRREAKANGTERIKP
jgi:ATP-dependent helicase IRC3